MPLIELSSVYKEYGSGSINAVGILHDINLSIDTGDFVALIGQSGSGKSTLMHILGGLDRPTRGVYRYAGQDVSKLNDLQLSQLRRNVFGFVFQGYFLLSGVSAKDNVELPALYAGRARGERAEHALHLLERLGLSGYSHHYPSQLSGGQQQRVSIARALMNGGTVLLADEPTGALDGASGEAVMQRLESLADEGRTVILVTHNPDIARRARRVIEICDGRIVSDRRFSPSPAKAPTIAGINNDRRTDLSGILGLAWRALWIAPLRSALTILGIVIGIAAVLVMMGIGEGSSRVMSQRLAGLGATLLTIFPSSSDDGGPPGELTTEDLAALGHLASINAVVPQILGKVTARYGAKNFKADVTATTSGAWEVNNWSVQSGMFFTPLHEQMRMPVVVLGAQVAQTLFHNTNPVGLYVLLDNVPFIVIGVLEAQGGASFGGSIDQNVLVPMLAGGLRLMGRSQADNVTLRARTTEEVFTAEKQINELLTLRHRRQDFAVSNRATILQTHEATMNVMTAFLGSIAAISLLVGGLGVMNVMLMAVTERTKEIGIRMAVGARPRDIHLQFLCEAVMLTLLGSIAGLVVGFVVSQVIHAFGKPVYIGALPVLLALSSAVITGLIFGYLPALKASNLDPVKALA